MEFSTKLAGAKLIVVLGHTHCGAIQGACLTDAKTPYKKLNLLLAKILPAISQVKKGMQDLDCTQYVDVDKISKQNVIQQMQYIYNHSDTIEKAGRG